MLLSVACVLALSGALRLAAAAVAGDLRYERSAWGWIVAAAVAVLAQA